MTGYTPNPTDGTNPTDDVSASTAAAEFRALKTYLQGIIAFGGTINISDILISPLSNRVSCLQCNGAAISRTTYATLFGIIGTTFGVGDGSTTFNLPTIAGPVANTYYVMKVE